MTGGDNYLNDFEPSKLPVQAKDLRAARDWWNSKTRKQKETLVAKHKLVSWPDLIRLYKAGN